MNMKSRIEKMEAALYKPEIDWGEIWDITNEMICTMGLSEEDKANLNRPELRENFIKMKTQEVRQ